MKKQVKKAKPKFKPGQKVWYNFFHEYGDPDRSPYYKPYKVKILSINNSGNCVVDSIDTGRFVKYDFQLFRTKKEAVEEHLKSKRSSIKAHRARIRELQKYIKQISNEFLLVT